MNAIPNQPEPSDSGTHHRLVVLGASGGTGRLVVRQALDAGHHVVACVRDPARLPLTHERLTVEVVDVTDPVALRPVVRDADAVLSALGGSGGTVCETAIRALLTALDDDTTGDTTGARIVVVSAQPVLRERRGPWWQRFVLLPIVRRVYRSQYADLAAMEAVLRASDADWTVLRPPYLTDDPPTGTYRVALESNPRARSSIARADLARALLDVLADRSTFRHALGVGGMPRISGRNAAPGQPVGRE